MSKDQCTLSCADVQYGKCNFGNNTCEYCKHGPDDPKCIYTMDYCKAAQQEGRCKNQTLTGLFRMIEVNPQYEIGEFDILFKDGKMYMQDVEDKVVAKELGDLKVTGQGESGGVIFEVDNWKSDPKIWPHDKLYGVFKKS